MIDIGYRAWQSAKALVKHRENENLEVSGNKATVKKKRNQLEVARYIENAVVFYDEYLKMREASPADIFRVYTRDALVAALDYSHCEEIGDTPVSSTVDYLAFVVNNYVSYCGGAPKEEIDNYTMLAFTAEDEDDIVALLDKIEMEVIGNAEEKEAPQQTAR